MKEQRFKFIRQFLILLYPVNNWFFVDIVSVWAFHIAVTAASGGWRGCTCFVKVIESCWYIVGRWGRTAKMNIFITGTGSSWFDITQFLFHSQ